MIRNVGQHASYADDMLHFAASEGMKLKKMQKTGPIVPISAI